MLPVALMAASLALTPAQSAKIDAVVAQVMHAHNIRGLALGVARKGHTVILRGYGYRSCDANAPVDGYTVFSVGSITKQFTAALVMQAADRGELPLDAAIKGITIGELLAQTSGLVNYTDAGQTLESALNAPPQFPPGTQWQYSNSNYYLLGTSLQDVTKQSYADLLAARITRPLRLTSTTFGPPLLAENVARGCVWSGDAWQPAPYRTIDEPAIAFSAGGLSSNVPDLLNWLGALDTGGIVNPDRFDAMTTSGTLPDGKPTHYGYGFFTADWYGLRIADHSGNIDGFTGEDGIVLDDGTAFAILTNADAIDLTPLAKSLVEIVEPLKNQALVASLGRAGIFEDPNVTKLVTTLVAQLAQDRLDRSLLTDAFNNRLTSARIRAYAAQLQPYGRLEQALFNDSTTIDTTTSETYTLNFARGRLVMVVSLRNGGVDAISLEAAR
ncbi:MAG TPA: serine hydrolase domain-containing protein [Candidatus Acidoferrales bacterium]|nr:serine hydrolase domain-containing protein [Candidatus Acidoferrales bacterium]